MWRCCLFTVTTTLVLWLGHSFFLESALWAQESAAAPAGEGATEGAEATADAKSSESKTPKEPVPVVLTNARETARTFVVAMEYDDVDAAIAAMDFSAIEPAPDAKEKAVLAKRLIEVIEQLPLIDPTQIDTAPDAPPFAFPLNEDEKSEIVVVPCPDGLWRFSPLTVAKITAMHAVLAEPAKAPTDPPKVTEAESPQPDTPATSEPEAATPVVPAAEVPDELRSARRVMRNLMDVLNEADSKRYHQVVASLDFSQVDPEPGQYAQVGMARQLKDVIDRMELIDYSQISDDPEGPAFLFPIESENQPIQISRGEDRIWRFSANTVAQIENLHEIYKDRPVVNVPEDEKPWYDRELMLGNETWRILALFIVIFLAILLGRTLRVAMRVWADSLERRGRAVISVVARTIGKTASPILLLIALNAALHFLTIEHAVEKTANTVIHIVFALLIGYILFRMVDVIVEFLRQVAVKSGSTLNDMLVPIVSTSLRLTVIVLVLLEIMTAVSNQPLPASLPGSEPADWPSAWRLKIRSRTSSVP